jgi:hypothetical protein
MSVRRPTTDWHLNQRWSFSVTPIFRAVCSKSVTTLVNYLHFSSLRDPQPLSGPMNGIACQFPVRPESILGLADIRQPPDMRFVGLSRSLVGYILLFSELAPEFRVSEFCGYCRTRTHLTLLRDTNPLYRCKGGDRVSGHTLSVRDIVRVVSVSRRSVRLSRRGRCK